LATKVGIIAGFEPFAEFDNNPSGEAVAHVQRFCEGFDATGLVLPVCFGQGWDMLQQTVDKLPKKARFAIVMAGLAGSRKEIEVERFALNCKDYRIPDNEKHQWTGEEVVPGAPAAIRSPAVDQELLATLKEKGFKCTISNHAGTFVCNELYYRALHDWQEEPRCAGVVFVHVPPAAAYIESSDEPASKESLQSPESTTGSSKSPKHEKETGKLQRRKSKTAGRKKTRDPSSQDKEPGYPIYRYAEALALIAGYLLK
jgi:pyroglutamyl-peptidase